MGSKPKNKMPIAERAKQFMPFSALKGLDEAIAKKERELLSTKEPSDEQAQKINEMLLRLKVHDIVCISYRGGKAVGQIELFDTALRALKIDGKQIWFDDIYSITEREN